MVRPDVEHQFAAQRDPVPFVSGRPDQIMTGIVMQFLEYLVETFFHSFRVVDVKIHYSVFWHVSWSFSQLGNRHPIRPISLSIAIQ
ncbi:MAG: hypothetical protein WA957_13505 [Alteraurantiacibacter sp.]